MQVICSILFGLLISQPQQSRPPQGLLDCEFRGSTYVCKGRP